MHDRLEQLSFLLIKSTVMLSISYILVWSLLRWLKIQAIRVQTFAWCGVLLQAVLLVSVSISVSIPGLPSNKATVPLDGAASESESRAQSSGSIRHELSELPPAEIPIVSVTTPALPKAASPSTKPAVSASSTQRAASVTVLLPIIAVWLTGIVFCLAWMGVSYVRFVRSLPTSLPVPDAWRSEWDTLSQSAQLNHSVRLYVTDDIGPAICWLPTGYLLLLPKQIWHHLSPAQRRLVMTHELAHVQRSDLWKSLTYRILAAIQWHNPFAWLAVRRLDECAEWSCDDQARALCQTDACQYVQTLLEISVHSHSVPTLVPAAAGHSLVRRAQRLLSPMFKEDSRMKTFFVFTVVCCAAFSGVVSFDLVAQESDNDRVRATAPTDTSDPETTVADKATPVRTIIESKAAPVILQDDGQIEVVRLQVDPATSLGSDATYVIVEESGHPKRVRMPGNTLTVVNSDGLAIEALDRAVGFVGRATLLTGTDAELNGVVASGVGTEAVIDMAFIFENLPEFNEQKELIRKAVRTAETQLKSDIIQIQAIQQKLTTATDAEAKQLSAEITRLKSKVDADRKESRLQLQTMESEMLLTTYTKIRKTVAAYAKEHGIRIVRRATTDRNPLNGLNSNDPKSIIRAMNAQVVYFAEEGVDITNDILERLKADTSGGAVDAADIQD